MRSVVLIIGVTLLGLRWIDVAVKRPPALVRVDTVHSVVYDTVTVIARAKDTVRIIEQHVGPLTEQRLARVICGTERSYGDDRDRFAFNAFGMVFCPNDGKK